MKPPFFYDPTFSFTNKTSHWKCHPAMASSHLALVDVNSLITSRKLATGPWLWATCHYRRGMIRSDLLRLLLGVPPLFFTFRSSRGWAVSTATLVCGWTVILAGGTAEHGQSAPRMAARSFPERRISPWTPWKCGPLENHLNRKRWETIESHKIVSELQGECLHPALFLLLFSIFNSWLISIEFSK